MKILFMGTPDFALFSLKALHGAGEEIVGVVTQPDKPRGRGYALTPPPVKVYAEESGMTVYQPSTLRGEEFAALLDTLSPELIVVVAYGKILPENVLRYAKHGCVNVHGSLLPEYRGAAPMQRAIIEGKKETGVTIKYMAEGVDTGDMLKIAKCEIGENDNFEVIHDRLAELGAKTLTEAIELIRCGKAERIPQDHSRATHAAKIEKEDCTIDFSKSAKEIHDLVRGLSPIPLAFTHTPDGKLLKIVETRVTGEKSTAPAGTVISVGEDIKISCGDGVISVLRLLPE
jgi:methionyl-tRNA formyltransferase